MAIADNPHKQPSRPWRQEISLSMFGPSLFTTLLIYLLEITFVISFAALIFSGELAGHLPKALSFIILGNAVMTTFVALLSSYPGTIAVAQDTLGAVLSIVAIAIVTVLPTAPLAQFATVIQDL